MDAGQTVEEKLAGFTEMVEVGPGVGLAGGTIAAIVDGFFV